MSKNTSFFNRRRRFVCMSALFVLGAMAMFFAAPFSFRSQAVVGNKPATAFVLDGQNDLPNYDIRTDESAAETISSFRVLAGRNASTVAAERRKFEAAEANLRERVPNLVVEYNQDLRAPEVISPDAKTGDGVLSRAASGERGEILRSFVRTNNELVGLTDAQVEDLRLTAQYTNPDGNLSFAHLEQFIGGVPVFAGEVKAGFTKRGEIIRVINNLAPALDYPSLSTDFGDAAGTARIAFASIKREAAEADLQINRARSNDLKLIFGAGDDATIAEKMYFPIEPGVARAAWRVLIWGNPASYYVVVDAETGALLWRKNITSHQTQAATFNVYASSDNMIKIADSPAPILPGPVSPVFGTQGNLINRTNVTLVGNEAPYTFNNNGWITDGNNATEGNNAIAGLDRVAPNGVDAPVAGTNRTFNFTYNPAPGNPAPGDEPLPAGQTPGQCSTAAQPVSDYQRGAVTQLFYAANRYHDELYLLGFTEQARNFQQDNFGRGGSGADRIFAEAQDCSNTNNANFSTSADGNSGRMQMFLFTNPTPDRDGDLDAGLVIHELTHGTSHRLIGNGVGLSSNMAGGMGEGWSDFYAHALLSEPTHPIQGIYTVGGYITKDLATMADKNYYYGVRRFPKAVISYTGPNGKPHNPLTFRHLNSNCNDEIGTTTQIGTISAFPRGPVGAATCDQVHNGGEIWSSALWEVRARFVQRLGWQIGNRKALQYVTDGMKLTPNNPTMLQARDAIVLAARNSGGTTDSNDVWKGFALRGMGFSAQIVAATSPATVIESFDEANLQQNPTFTISDANGNNNGFPEPGEQIELTIPLKNPINETANDVQLQVVGGGTANYGAIAANQTVSRTVTYTVPANTACGSVLTLTFSITSSLGPVTITRNITIGSPIVTLTENFDTVTAPNLPTGWTSSVTAAGTGWTTTAVAPDTVPNAASASAPAVGGGSELTSPAIPISSQAALLTFRHSYNLQTSFDGATLEIKIGSDIFRNIESAGGAFTEGAFNVVLQGTGNPIAGQRGWNGNSNGYITSSVRLPASANGQNVQFRFRIGHNQSIASQGWKIDTLRVSGGYTCSLTATFARDDFDGDGKTDRTVFRPDNGVWYSLRSTAGFTGTTWGSATDTILPGDFDGDGKADHAVFRATDSSGTFFVLNSQNNTVSTTQWGAANDTPVIGDFNGDSRSDYGVFRPSNGTWYILPAGGAAVISQQFGQSGDRPVVGNFDGDARSDFAVYRGGTWYVLASTAGFSGVQFGLANDTAVPADYDNDNKDDIAVFRDGAWFIIRSTTGAFQTISFGQAGDVPVPGDYDGDGADDAAVYRGGIWYTLGSTAGFSAVQFGAANDRPLPAARTAQP